jgi:outer membrane lipoprotein-sorting protein
MKYTILMALFLGISTSLMAQKDDRAKVILDNMAKNFDAKKAYEAKIRQEVVSTVQGKTLDDIVATVLIFGDRYKIDAGSQVIYNDGQTIWTWLKDVDEVNVDNVSDDGDDALMTPSKIFELYQDQFKYLYLGDKLIDGKKHYIVDLSPENPQNNKYDFYKVTLYIDQSNNMLNKWELFEKGNAKQYNYSIESFTNDLKVSDKDFRFDENANSDVEVIDFR